MNVSDKNSVVTPHLAAICTEFGDKADVIIDNIVTKLLAEGKNVAGMLQRASGTRISGCAAKLQSIESGEYHRITQALGNDSISCNVDVEALEQVAHTVAESLSSDLDLVIVNRFGKRESVGGGFCCVIQRALELGIPVLTVVNTQWQQRWHDYGAGYVTTLPVSSPCVLDWCHASIGHLPSSDATKVQRQQTDAVTA